MDTRDLAACVGPWYKELDERRMLARAEIWGEDDEGEFTEEINVPFRWQVCPLCDGKGRHVNPSVDSHGISSEEFDEDPDFAEDYLRGHYDVTCYQCAGRRVVPVTDDERVLKTIREREEQSIEEAAMLRMGY